MARDAALRALASEVAATGTRWAFVFYSLQLAAVRAAVTNSLVDAGW